MVDLNDKSAIAAIDKSNAYSSVINLSKQCRQAWEETQGINFPDAYRNINNIVLCGMGGSAYAALIIKSLYNDSLSIPFELINGYNLPKYIDNNSLVLLSSYSGSTEEVLSCAEESLKRKAKIAGVCEGSKLGEFLKNNSLPSYIFDAKFNPSKQPRLGQGYMVFGHVGILNELGFLSLSNDNVKSAISFLENNNNQIEQFAKDAVDSLIEKIPIIVAAEHLSGNAHILRNQFNETAKNFASYSIIPELNHHLMEGLSHPQEKILTFLLFKSSLYSPVIQKRFQLTREVIEKNGVKVAEIDILGDNVLEQMLYALAFGGYLSFYLGITYGHDPSLIPWVSWFKEKLHE